MADEQIMGSAESKNKLASYWEIFRHSWPILLENPKPLLVLAVTLALVSQVFDHLSALLMAPYMQDINAFFELAQTPDLTPEHSQAFIEAIKTIGFSRLLVSMSLPLILAPWIWLVLCRVAVNIWDGYRPGLESLWFALKYYGPAVRIMILISILILGLFLATIVCFVPMLLVKQLTGSSGQANMIGWLLTMGGIVAGLVFFVRILWPHIRRLVVLQFLAFFSLSDGEKGAWIKIIGRIHAALAGFPKHLNQCVLILFLTACIISMITSLLAVLFLTVGLPELVIKMVLNVIFYLGLLWPLVALAGFHRLAFSTEADQEGAGEARPEGVGMAEGA
ncbi:MAG: hypothetical protein LBT47_13965 [Deltaproteobacteria bacterium]|jgi:hypothetical protein|nr:hypothetical protein [Deltaproteobacteria bacterium]